MKSFFTIIGLLFIPVIAFATVTISDGTIVQTTNGNLTVSGDGIVDTVTVGGTTFTVTLSQAQSIIFSSSGLKDLSATQAGSLQVSTTCGTSASTLTLTNPSNSGQTQTTTVSVSSDTCKGGGGGGGIVVTPGSDISGYLQGPTVQATPAPTPAPVSPSSPVPEQISNQIAPAITTFSRDLEFGNRGEDVKNLQRLLATDKSIYPQGTVSGYFGSLTQQAVKRFQKKYNIKQVGRVGPMTREKISIVFAQQMGSALNTKNDNSQQEELQSILKRLKELQELLKKLGG